MKRFLSFLSGAMTGGLVGAAIAILMAPSSGEELREDLRMRTTQFRDDISQAAYNRRIELERQLASLRSPQDME